MAFMPNGFGQIIGRRAWVCVSLLLLAATGCSSFDNEWKAASAVPAAEGDISGRWEGNWRSGQSGNGGGLRCVVSRIDRKTFRAHFDATYASALHFDYVVNLTGATADDGYTYFEGEANLGVFAGGKYQYNGRADDDEFYSTYRSESDRGQFTLARPGGQAPEPEAAEAAELQ